MTNPIPTVPAAVPGEFILAFTEKILGECKIEEENIFIKSNSLQEKKIDEEVILPPLLKSTRANGNKEIETMIVVFENYKTPLTKSEIKIYQNFTISENGEPQLTYYVCYDRKDHTPGDTYRAHSLKLTNIPVTYASFDDTQGMKKLEMVLIESVKAFLINIDPKASRGTVTTVKPPVKE